MRRRILFIDNDLDFLDVRVRRLQADGFDVQTATDLDQAEELLKRNWVHLAIVDVRMREENDDKDTSGISLAKNPDYAAIPKIILTKYPGFEYVREALGPVVDGMPPAVGFLSKKEGYDAMLAAIKEAFDQYVCIDWDLSIFWRRGELASFGQLAAFIEPRVNLFPLISQEFEDLFRKLFNTYKQVSISRLFWKKGGRAALEVFAYSEDSERQFLVTFGKVEEMRIEREGYSNCVLKTHAAPGLSEALSKETLHYAATAWLMPGQQDIETARTFSDYYREMPDNKVRTAVDNFFQSALTGFHKQGESGMERADLAQVTLELGGIGTGGFTEENFDAATRGVIKQALQRRLLEEASFVDGQFYLSFPGGNRMNVVNPTPYLYNMGRLPSKPVAWWYSPGEVSAETILVDQNGYAWLSDYYGCRPAPVYQDFVSFENCLRFNLMENRNPISLQQLEKELISAGSLNTAINSSSVEPDCRKAFSVIQGVRRNASQAVGRDPVPYYIALLIDAAKGFRDYDPGRRLSRGEISSLLHRLVLCGLLCEAIDRGRDPLPGKIQPHKNLGLRMDETRREVSVGGKKVSLTRTEYSLLNYLYRRAGKLVTRADILRDVFDYADADRTAQKSLLNTQMGRLRKKIEPDPGKPTYISTIRGEGYMLVENPSEDDEG